LVSAHIFFVHYTATLDIYTLSLHDALPIFVSSGQPIPMRPLKLQLLLKTLQVEHEVLDGLISFLPILSQRLADDAFQLSRHVRRSEEHTSELQSLTNLVCRLLLEKKNQTPD